MATIYDVARQAGVSPKTVSRVLNQEPNVRESTIEVVRNAISVLDYRPSIAARLMKSQRTKVVGFLTDRVVTSPESNAIARGVAEAARERGYTVIFVNDADVDTPLEGTAVNQLLDLKVDGLIYASHLLRPVNVEAYRGRNRPLVLANCFSENRDFTSIIPDDYRGGQMAGELIISQGHRRVAMLNLDEPSIAAGERSGGFLDAFSQVGQPAPQVVTALFENAGTWDEHDRLPDILDALLAQPEPPTVLFCGNDKMAMVVYGLLAQRSIRVPEEISVLGYDDFPHICQLLRPRLSSVSIAHDVIGMRAFEELYRQLQRDPGEPKAEPLAIKIEGQAIHRPSLKAP